MDKKLSELLKELSIKVCSMCYNTDYEICKECRIAQIINQILLEYSK